MKMATADVRVSRGNIESARRLIETAKKYKERYSELGAKRMGDLSRGQKPTKLAIMPAHGINEFQVDATKEYKPGQIFTVTCAESISFEEDSVAKGSVFYAIEHLKIRDIEVHGPGKPPASSGRALQKEFPVWSEIAAMDSECGWGLKLGTAGSTAKATSHYYYYEAGRSTGEGWLVDERYQHGGDTTGLGNALLMSQSRISSSSVGHFATEALVIECADSRIIGRQVFEGHDIALVSNAGNVLSPIALDAIEAAVKEGVPAIVIMGHSNCGAVGAAIAKNTEAPLAEIMLAVQTNIAGWENNVQTLVEVRNAFASVEMLQGIRRPEVYPGRVGEVANLISQRGTAVVPLYLDLSSGEIGGGI
ncbi:hypothetical protein JW721_03105 [Candidatus Micrarchaeota archaeon]|nr:hypothetical protein [Candidatus Micrarchaeota archaeon]